MFSYLIKFKLLTRKDYIEGGEFTANNDEEAGKEARRRFEEAKKLNRNLIGFVVYKLIFSGLG